MRKNGLEIVAVSKDVMTVDFYSVIDVATGRIIECCETYAEAERERDAYLEAMHSFNAGPFSA